MNLNLILLDDLLLHEEVESVLTLVTLKLDDSTQLLRIDQSTVAAEQLLKGLNQTVKIKVLWQTADGGQGLTACTLLNTNVNIVCRHRFRLFRGCVEGVKGRTKRTDGHTTTESAGSVVERKLHKKGTNTQQKRKNTHTNNNSKN